MFRQDDTMYASHSAIISFEEILEATEVVIDEDTCEAPWDTRDGWEHTAISTNRFQDTSDMQGRVHWARLVIELDDDDHGIFDYARRRTLAQLVKWYEDGWQWYGVKCCFKVLGNEYGDSIWGIDDANFAEEVREEVALQVAAQLEKSGYTVTDKPGRPSPTRANNLDSQNWRG